MDTIQQCKKTLDMEKTLDIIKKKLLSTAELIKKRQDKIVTITEIYRKIMLGYYAYSDLQLLLLLMKDNPTTDKYNNIVEKEQDTRQKLIQTIKDSIEKISESEMLEIKQQLQLIGIELEYL